MLLLFSIIILMAILFPVLTRVWGWTYNGWRDPDGPFDYHDFWGGVMGALIGLMLSFPVQIILYNVFDPELQTVEVNRIEIEGLKDNANVNGLFVLGSGTIDTQQYYYFMKKTSVGLQMDKVSAFAVPLKETNEEAPALVTTVEKIDDKWDNWFALWVQDSEPSQYLVVPMGTVTKEYNVDME